MTVNTGTQNKHKVGKVVAIDEKNKQNIWKTDKCNEISGSDGFIYGPHEVRSHQDVLVYLPEFCRNLPLVFAKVREIL